MSHEHLADSVGLHYHRRHSAYPTRDPSAACRVNSDRVLVVDHMTLIDVRPGVRSGKPCYVGTRITVYDVLEYLAGGMSADDIVADFPELTLAHVHAAPFIRGAP
jgi:uncharacterized protein (DUF433 family)